MDVRRSWQKMDRGYVRCGPFHLVRTANLPWELYWADSGRLIAAFEGLVVAKRWLIENHERLRQGKSPSWEASEFRRRRRAAELGEGLQASLKAQGLAKDPKS